MMTHPELVAGKGWAATILMLAASGLAAVRSGAEGIFAAVLPVRGLDVALKVDDGAARASEAAMAALLTRDCALDPGDPAATGHADATVRNWRGLVAGRLRAADALG